MSEQTILQTLAAAEKAGLLPNTVHHWLPALLRYNEAFLASQPKPAPALLTDDEVWSKVIGPWDNTNKPTTLDGLVRVAESVVLRNNRIGGE
jgi:hypothetical protein